MAKRRNDFDDPIAIDQGGTGADNAGDARTSLGITIGASTIVGTTDEIVVTNGDGSGGDPTISLAVDAVMPGASAITPPVGGTAARPLTPVEGMLRGNSDTGFAELYSNGSWGSPIFTINGTLNQIDITGGNTVSISNDAILPGFGAVTTPVGTNAQQPVGTLGMIRGNSDTGFIEIYSDGSWRPQGRVIVGTVNQITVLNGDGISGDPTILISDDAIFPGDGAVTLPDGTTAQRPGAPVLGMARGNTDTGFVEIYSDGAWRPQGREIQGTTNQIDVADGDGIAGDPTISISDDAILPGNGAVTAPTGTTAQQPAGTLGMVRGNSDTGFIEIYSDSAWRPQGREIQGTTDQISVTNGDGIAGDPTVALADNPIVPGNASVTVPTGTTAQRPGSPVLGMVRANSDTNMIEVYSDGIWVGLNFIANYLTGYLNTVVSVTSMSFGPGQCADSANSTYLSSSSTITKLINANWAEGDSNGGFPSALTLSNNTVYYTFVIAKADGTVDFGFDTSLTATNLLADASGDGYVDYRRIGSCRTQIGSNDLETIRQEGDYFYYETQRQDFTVAYTGAGTLDNVVPISVPDTITVIAQVLSNSARSSAGGGETTKVYLMPTTTTGAADSYYSHQTDAGGNASNGAGVYNIPTEVGTLRHYAVVVGGASDGGAFITTLGWYDRRDQ